jgi:hypothetical protein
MTELSDLHKNILAYCSDDYTDLSTIVNVITEAGTILRHLSLEELQEKVLGIRKEWNEHLREGVPWPAPWEIVCFVSITEGERGQSSGSGL